MTSMLPSLLSLPAAGKETLLEAGLSSGGSERADCLVNISSRTLAVEFGCLSNADNEM